MVLLKSIFIFTILILSETELKLIGEQIETNSTISKSEGKFEYTFENSKEGAQALSQKMKELRGTFPSDECIINFSRSDEGYYDKWVRDTPKNFGDTGNLNHLQLADLCKKAHGKE
ncbi:hypothetical protein A0128_20270 [Leptospira tipperaryensis]|uniref:Uncharacterized protein n=1 Tax=Leptospira tipperaryensis TaxID=2564040 RepID=A0A1D7V3F8_9LEPT|nr:hypothetical protein [Leptospira tipperaryensis]AOP36356.1 hypothetical protein A0128_20270 [Leptospira tipperaryensis]